jgi:hypothetical protein
VQQGIARPCKWAPRFMQWFSGESGKSSRHFKTCMLVDCGGYDDCLHGYNNDKRCFIGWGCKALDGTYSDNKT